MAIGSDYTKAFADRLSDLLNEKRQDGKTLKDIAMESGIPTGSLSKYQNDAAEAGVNSLVKLAKYFDVSTDYLLGITEIKSGNADDMAIEKRIGFNSHTLHNLDYFYEKDKCVFINLLFAGGFSKILLGCQEAFENYIFASRDERNAFTQPKEREEYENKYSDYYPVKNDDSLGFTLTFTAENYYTFCVQQLCSELEYFLLTVTEKAESRLILHDQNNADVNKRVQIANKRKIKEG